MQIRGRSLTLRLLLAMLLWPSVPARMGTAATAPITEAQVEAAYLYNFAKFVEWTEQSFASGSAPVQICVLNDSAFQSTLKQMVSSRSIDGRPVQVLSVQTAADAQNCHILFIAAAQEKQAGTVLDSLRNSGILTVGETQDFLKHGGMIGFELLNGRVQFEVNLKAANQAGLHISARLLSVANRVIQ